MTYSTIYQNLKLNSLHFQIFFPFLVMNIQFVLFQSNQSFNVFIFMKFTHISMYMFECLGDYHSNKRSELKDACMEDRLFYVLCKFCLQRTKKYIHLFEIRNRNLFPSFTEQPT